MECIDEIEAAIEHSPSGEGECAVLVAEPILGAGGGVTPPLAYWNEVQARLRQKGVLLAFDEVQTFGRTGHFFAAHYYDVEPDLIAVAKGISGTGLPGAAAVLMPKELAVLTAEERSLTGGASVVAAKAITATIEVMSSPGFWRNFSRSAELLREHLERLARKFDCIGTVRGTGLMTGLEIVFSREGRKPDPAKANAIITYGLRNRLVLRGSLYGRGSFVKIRPALTITAEEVDELCDRLEISIAQACGQ